jgi:aspartyl/asparaginyl beta-hydroxylase (cupin superfamily)
MILFIIVLIISLLLYIKYDKIDKPFYNIKEINKKLFLLEDNHKIIEKELNNANLIWVKWPETYLYENNNWSIIPIFAFGKWINKYKSFFPLTLNILSQIDNIETILFSKLKPNTIIDPHQGWEELSNRILRCHLCLTIADKGINYISVSNLKKYHKKGELIIFDDSKLHYSINKSNEDRIVLIIDIKRPNHIEKGKSKIKKTPQLIKLINKYLLT